MRSFFAASLVLLISSALIIAQESSKPSGEERHLNKARMPPRSTSSSQTPSCMWITTAP